MLLGHGDRSGFEREREGLREERGESKIRVGAKWRMSSPGTTHCFPSFRSLGVVCFKK